MSLSLLSLSNICECGLSPPEWSLLLVSIHPNDMFLSPRVEVTQSPSPFSYYTIVLSSSIKSIISMALYHYYIAFYSLN
jgi:hypothetical protein